MELTPQDVQQKKFERAKRGFDPQEVGAFLDKVAAAVAARDRELHEARTEIEALNRAVVDVKQNEEAFRLTMNAATEAKEEMLRRAAEDAKRLEDEARQGAEVIVERARVEAESRIVSIKREVEALREEKKRLEHQIADMRGTAATVQNSLDALDIPEASNGRPALELVVDKNNPVSPEPSELAARVGDLRG
ncbi:MAG: DivIVA domain-containing protein [Acidimicrobiia bacterium]|nr:DivIVA domain-containing protein [Acidimicrobiia bacterium]